METNAAADTIMPSYVLVSQISSSETCYEKRKIRLHGSKTVENVFMACLQAVTSSKVLLDLKFPVAAAI